MTPSANSSRSVGIPNVCGMAIVAEGSSAATDYSDRSRTATVLASAPFSLAQYRPVQSFLIGRQICDALVSEFRRQHNAKRSYAFKVRFSNGVRTDFECAELNPRSRAATEVLQVIKRHVRCRRCSTI